MIREKLTPHQFSQLTSSQRNEYKDNLSKDESKPVDALSDEALRFNWLRNPVTLSLIKFLSDEIDSLHRLAEHAMSNRDHEGVAEFLAQAKYARKIKQTIEKGNK